jgi:hypothetical protein
MMADPADGAGGYGNKKATANSGFGMAQIIL